MIVIIIETFANEKLNSHRFELTCQVDGNPPPHIHWVYEYHLTNFLEQIKNESSEVSRFKSVVREVSKHVVKCAAPEDQGTLFCIGISKPNVAISKPAYIRVIGKFKTLCLTNI